MWLPRRPLCLRGALSKCYVSLHFQAHNGQVAAVLLPNLSKSNDLHHMSFCGRCCLVLRWHFCMKYTKPLFSLGKPLLTRMTLCKAWALLGPNIPHVASFPALIIVAKPNKTATWRPKSHSHGVQCIESRSHCTRCAKITESLVFL